MYLVGRAGSKFKSLSPFLSRGRRASRPQGRGRGGATILQCFWQRCCYSQAEQSSHLFEGDSRVLGVSQQMLLAVHSLLGRCCTENVSEQPLVFSLSIPGNACFHRPEGIAVATRGAGPSPQHSHCENPTENTFIKFSSSAPNRGLPDLRLGFSYQCIDFEVLLSARGSIGFCSEGHGLV